MELGLNKITGTDKQTIEMLKDKVLSGGGGGSGGSLGISFGQTNEEIEGVMTKTITTEITDLSSINFVFIGNVDFFQFEYLEGSIVPHQICPVISRTSSHIAFNAITTYENQVIEMSLDLEQGVSTEESHDDIEGNASFKLYSL